MLTPRGWWLLLMLFGLMMIGMIIEQRSETAVVLLPLSIFLWFCYEWIMFRVRLVRVVPNVRMVRRFYVDGRQVPSLWTGRTATVEVSFWTDESLGLPLVHAQDLLPIEATLIDGVSSDFIVINEDPLSLRYEIRTKAPGTLRFEGVQLRLADLQGFFYARICLHQPILLPVLPMLSDSEGQQRIDKRLNLLTPPGVHEHRKPGSGSELLDLREYRPGDPPKMIAWKASARRDRLIVREYEAEVPIRCTLFVDCSQSMRVGPPGETPLNRMITLTATVAQAAILRRDLVGLTLIDETSAEITRPARSAQHLMQVMHTLALSTVPRNRDEPLSGDMLGDIPVLVPLAVSLASETYPELLRSEVNSTPMLMYWHALLDSWLGKRVLAMMMSPMLLLIPLVRRNVAALAGVLAPTDRWIVPVFLGLCLAPIILGLIFWGLYGLIGLIPGVQFRMGQRKRIAAVIAEVQQLHEGAISRMQQDDAYFGQRLQVFLAAHHIPYPLPRSTDTADRLNPGREKLDVLSAAMSQAIFRGRDNELFVLLIDLIELDSVLDPLIRTIRVARARHHQVLVICPWLSGVPLPGEMIVTPSRSIDKPMTVKALQSHLRDQMIQRYHQAYDRVKHELARFGITILAYSAETSAKVILDRMERLRKPLRIG